MRARNIIIVITINFFILTPAFSQSIDSYNFVSRYLSATLTEKEEQSLQHKETYQYHKAEVLKDWKATNKKILDGVTIFENSEIDSLSKDSHILFYPFSGPDLLYADKFFPNQDKIIMVGLEPIGSPLEIKQNSLPHYLKALRHALFYPNQIGFYRTLSMEKDFKDPLLNGTLHHLLYYIGRLGYTIVDIRTFTLMPNGKLKPSDYDGCNVIGMKYKKTGSNKIKKLLYFSTDLSNKGIKSSNYALIKYLKNNSDYNVLLKSASYLLPRPYFSIILNEIIDNAELIVQDDTGVPYRTINTPQWDVSLYGDYTKTIALFKNYFQKDLAQAMLQQSKGKLPFGIGYNLHHGECIMMVAKKNED